MYQSRVVGSYISGPPAAGAVGTKSTVIFFKSRYVTLYLVTKLTHHEGVDEDDVEHTVGAEIGPQCLLDQALLCGSLHIDLSLQRIVAAVREGVSLPQECRQEQVEQYHRGLRGKIGLLSKHSQHGGSYGSEREHVDIKKFPLLQYIQGDHPSW